MFPVSCHIVRGAQILFHISERVFHISSSNNVRAADQISASLSRGGRCNVSTALLVAARHPPPSLPCPHCVSLFFFFCCGLTFTFIFSESGECVGVCYTTLRSIKSPLCCSPNVNQTKKKEKGAFCSQFGFHPAALIGTISRSGGLLYFKSWRTNGRESVFIVSTCPGLGSCEISGEELRILGRARIRPSLSG